jgi:hypothetical protein
LKPRHQSGYSEPYTADCERVLLTLLSGLGPYRDSLCLVGGLTPRYLVKRRPPEVPPHAGTGDVDIVVNLTVITGASADAYATLEKNLERLGFERATNDEGKVQSWRWQTKTAKGATMIVEFLADDPDHPNIRAQPLPSQRRVSAINIPKSSMVFDLFERREIAGELLNGGGKIVQEIRYANIVAHTCLKVFCYADRREGKDAYDLIYCLEYADGGLGAVAAQFRQALQGKHKSTIAEALELIRRRFASDDKIAGFEKDGPTAVARFEIAEDEVDAAERRVLRRREVATVIEAVLKAIES